MAHALLSPSSAERWMACPGSVALTMGLPDTTSEFAIEGTAAHELAAKCLDGWNNPYDFIGQEFCGVRVDREMAENIQVYLDYINQIIATGDCQMLIEQALDISAITGEQDAKGTSDCVIITPDELIVVDLKYGRGVKVTAQENKQLMLYGLAALQEHELVQDFPQVRLVIVQPRLKHISEWTITPDDLRNFGESVAACSSVIDQVLKEAQNLDFVDPGFLHPSESACKFCKAKGACPALRDEVLTKVAEDFPDLTEPVAPQLEQSLRDPGTLTNEQLSNLLGAVDLIEDWCRALRARAEAELFAGREVPGYKLVEGRKGARTWADPTEVEATLKAMRLKTEQMYDFKLITPTTAEKLRKEGVIGPRQWPKLQTLIAQSEGKPAVVPVTDKRPALVITPTEDGFDDETIQDLV